MPINEVFWSANLTTNLLSVGQLMKNEVIFTKSRCSIYNKNSELFAITYVVKGVYILRVTESELIASAVTGIMLHGRHVNGKYLNKMPSAIESMNLDKEVDISKSSYIL